MKSKRWIYLSLGLLTLIFSFGWFSHTLNSNGTYSIGQPIDNLNGINVYYNGGVKNISGRTLGADNYNIGLKYQCVEFVKRYYYEHLNHKMPNSYGHAKDFFKRGLGDGQMNEGRNLIQYTNPSKSKPKPDDLLIYKETLFNKFGHVAIVSKVTDNEIEIVQQNPGPSAKSRANISLQYHSGEWRIRNKRILGWLRKE